MWSALLEIEKRNIIVINDRIDITSFIDGSLYLNNGCYTIVLDKSRPAQNNMIIDDLQIIHKIDDAVAYRNSEDPNVQGWVLFVNKEDGMLSSLSSVAHIVEKPHLKLLEYQMNEVGLSRKHVGQLSELVSRDEIDEKRFWAALQSQNRTDLVRSLGVIYAESEDIKKYNYDYREIISQHLSDSSMLEDTLSGLSSDQANDYSRFIEGLKKSVIQDYNFEEELSRELSDADLQGLLAEINLPYKAPVKLSAKVRLSGRSYKRVNSKLFFYSSGDTKISIGLENTDGYVVTNEAPGHRRPCRAGEFLDITTHVSTLDVKVTGEVKSAGSLAYTFYSVSEENEGAYILDKARFIRMTSSQLEYTLNTFNQSTVVYIIHKNDDIPRCDDAQVDKLFQGDSFSLSQVSAFNSEDSSISIRLREQEYTIFGFNLNEAETVVLRDSIEKKRLSGLDYGNRVFSVVNSTVICELEKTLLRSNGLSIIKSYGTESFVDEGNPVYCPKIDQFDVLENKCEINANELLDCWKEIKDKLLLFEYRPSTYLSLLRELGYDSIRRFYDLYSASLETDFIQASKFLTIVILEDTKAQSVVLPFYHPIVLMDIYTFFENYHIDERISLNAHHTPSFLKSVWMNNETFIVLENTGVFQPVFKHERCDLAKLIKDLGLNQDANTYSRHRPLNDDQIIRSFDAMFDYHGFSRTFHVRLLIDNESEIRRLVALILANRSFLDRLNTSTLYIHLSKVLFEALNTYYTQGYDFIKLACAESTTEYDLLIDARQNDDVKYANRPATTEVTPNFMSAGVPLFPCEGQGLMTVHVIYPARFTAHNKLASPNNQNFVVVSRSRDQEIDDYNRAKIISLQNERFNLLSSTLSHLVYEMRSANRLRFSSYQKTNFVIAIRGTKQLRARLAHGLAEYDITEYLSDIEKGLLQENLFSFSHMFGNRNKMKGIVGELMTFRALDLLCSDFETGYLIPLDPIIGELQLYLRTSSQVKWTRYPDFLLLRFQDGTCNFHFIEVKSRLECDYQNVRDEQLSPIRRAIGDWLNDIGSGELERKRFVSFLIEYLIRVMLDKLPSSRLESIYGWISSSPAEIRLQDSVLVHLNDFPNSCVKYEDDFIVVQHSFRSALSEYLEKNENNSLSKELEVVFNSSTDGSNQTSPEKLDDPEYGIETAEKELLQLSDNGLGVDADLGNVAFDLLKGREDLYSALELAYKEVQRRLGREGLYLNDSENSVKLSPMNVCFSYAISEGVSIKNVKGKSSDIALWLKLPQGQSVEIDSDMGNVVMEYPLPPSSRMFFQYSEICNAKTSDEELSVPIGVDEDGRVVVFEFGSNSPHLLIGGTTGAGKSVALETIVGGLLTRYDHTQLNVVIVDPKQTELVDFEVARAVRENCLNADVGFNADDAIEILTNAVAEMDRRNSLFASMSRELKSMSKITRSLKNISDYNKNTIREKLPRVVIVLDEYADLVSDSTKKKELQNHLVRIAQKGRSTGIHLIVATQKPVVEVIDTVVKSNLPASLALRVSKVNDSIVIMDEGGAEGLLGQGDAFLKIGSQKTRLQIAKFGEDQFGLLS